MISKATIFDCKAIANIHKTYFEEAWSEDFFCQTVNDCRYVFIKYEEAKEIAGFCLCLAIKPEIEILSICTIEKFRKLGIATSLLEYIKNLPDYNAIFLEVSKNNIPAINLYKKANFKEEYIRKGYYIEKGQAVDAIIMKSIIRD